MTHVSSHNEEDDDPVIATFDVFNVSSLAGSLHLFQYPLRAAFRPYEASSISMAVTSGCVVDVASGAATASSDGANNIVDYERMGDIGDQHGIDFSR